MVGKDLPSKTRLKMLAKRQVKGISRLSYTEALDRIAQKFGMQDYAEFIRLEERKRRAGQVSQDMIEDVLGWFRREAAFLGVDFSIFYPTETGLSKSILDATSPVRLHFLTTNFHDYGRQEKGLAHRVRCPAYFVVRGQEFPRTVSLYRPMTKNGDPRMWFSGLAEFAYANDTLAIVISDRTPYLFNLSALAREISTTYGRNSDTQQLLFAVAGANAVGSVGLGQAWNSQQLPSGLKSTLDFLIRIGNRNEIHSQDLLRELRKIARTGAIRSTASGDTAVGMALEAALEIKANSSAAPDYRGRIELKAARRKVRGQRTRQSLFAQVADWGHVKSTLKSSAAILEEYGYTRGGLKKLYCSVSAIGPNSQGLFFKLSDDETLLMEVDRNGGVVAVWQLATLMARLLQKHSETFWVEASSSIDSEGVEWFTLLSARHTKAPLASQLLTLIREGHVTMDHLIKQREDGSVAEKGPLFKLAPSAFHLLFPEPVVYRLDVSNPE